MLNRKKKFAEGCGFFKLASLFIIGAFIGDIVETIFCLITTGRLMSRKQSCVWSVQYRVGNCMCASDMDFI